MNILHSVQVDGFWGTKTLTIDFHRDVNFLIGVNGSGKTTLINMIAAALSADLPMLDRLPFETMHLHLQDTEGRRKPVIEVHRHIGKESPFPRVSYTVRDKSSDPPAIYELDDMVQQRTYSREHIIYRERIRRAGYAIVEHLKRLVQLTWLTIHRIPITGLRGEDRNFESTVDKKVDQMSTELVKYFSLLNRQADAEQAKFQEAVFLSLLAQQSSNAFVEIAKLDLAQEREALAQIFEKFKLERPAFVPLLEQHRRSTIRPGCGEKGLYDDAGSRDFCYEQNPFGSSRMAQINRTAASNIRTAGRLSWNTQQNDGQERIQG